MNCEYCGKPGKTVVLRCVTHEDGVIGEYYAEPVFCPKCVIEAQKEALEANGTYIVCMEPLVYGGA